METEQEPVVEDPNKVSGGPTQDEKEAPAEPKPPESKPLHEGLSGSLTTTEDLVSYTKNLEGLLIASKRGQEQSPKTFVSPPAAPASTETEAFESLIYTDPVKAKASMFAEWERRQAAKEATAKRQESFWGSFYSQNSDLKDLQHVVQSVFKRDRAEIGSLPSDKEVAEHLAKEARSLVGLIKKQVGVTETLVDSTPAVTFGSSGAPRQVQPATPTKPLSFADQIMRMKKRK